MYKQVGKVVELPILNLLRRNLLRFSLQFFKNIYFQYYQS